MEKLLSGKKILIMGAANKRSIAWGCAQAMLDNGAELIFTYQNERLKKSLLRLVSDEERLVECDVAKDESIAQAFDTILDKFGKIDGIVHAIAFANKDELAGDIMNSSRAGYALAQDISAYSLIAVSKYAVKLLNNPASIVTLTYFGSERAIPNYNVMGVAKAALEANVRYLARDMAKYGVRVNAISAGAVKTLAVTGVKDHGDLLRISEERTVDGKSVTTKEIGGAAAFLVSDLSTGVVGDTIYVDKGVHLI
ncbi:enoyl-ACP reductase FabI [Liquorilactobacillus satsumensis]|uniref:enoyl-ACP reductase FabI n=2 Tax=Liquorilactobacillus satsumensis TaxID=259059 RepID=UPI000A6047D9|nr:enoyl-ACP reductase FabI [Liquorilactobacillus satsumensis]MCC7666729.1 enoyl-[acyl-carrier-protein] reductase FabI [Liquorilactobacillus satsumensis]MCP9312652.1 enoyl-ACP reductase FabI [Liquorilactobacillus satsumensis]MCP9327569.1 enoyl-ACP reductase FabI [Liquorilactobacillus satsumensis]MCP9357605.1 enoyl-ACP reductase FabI [Liquorilactobacillus satsumensis]MCP9359838.1 enoyl-ACP reductase FabI [Liquorilactobacillus satsumensis]